jgi:hypothetical protein
MRPPAARTPAGGTDEYGLVKIRYKLPKSDVSSRAEEFHLRALPEPHVNLSIHTAPDVRPLP